MQFTQLFDDERAVSPVIGVILMVAITVILAAVIGTFVLGLGDQVQQTTPQASFGFDIEEDADANGDVLTVTHESGDTIDGANLKVSATTTFNATDSSGTWAGYGDSTTFANTSRTSISAGTTIKLGNADFSGNTVRIIYDDPTSDSSATLAKQEF
jgi:flagellin-like protein